MSSNTDRFNQMSQDLSLIFSHSIFIAPFYLRKSLGSYWDDSVANFTYLPELSSRIEAQLLTAIICSIKSNFFAFLFPFPVSFLHSSAGASEILFVSGHASGETQSKTHSTHLFTDPKYQKLVLQKLPIYRFKTQHYIDNIVNCI